MNIHIAVISETEKFKGLSENYKIKARVNYKIEYNELCVRYDGHIFASWRSFDTFKFYRWNRSNALLQQKNRLPQKRGYGNNTNTGLKPVILKPGTGYRF